MAFFAQKNGNGGNGNVEKSVGNLGRNSVLRMLEQFNLDDGIKLDVPMFDGKIQPGVFLDWLHEVDKELDFKDLDDPMRVQSVAAKLTGDALVWWEKLEQKQHTWEGMRRELKREFVPDEYQMHLYMLVLNLNQGPRQTVADYTEQFFLLANRAEWVDQTKQHKVWRYLNGLNKSIQNALYLKDFFDMSNAIEYAYKAEELLQRLSVSSKGLVPKMSPGYITFDFLEESTDAFTHADSGKPLLMPSSVVGSPPPKDIKTWCNSGVFWSRCTSGGKLCDVVFGSGSTDSFVSEDMVTGLNLKTELLAKPFRAVTPFGDVGIVVDRRCRVSFSIGPKFKEDIYCFVYPLKLAHLLLGRPWFNDRNAILSVGGDKTISVKYKGGRVVLASLPSFETMCCTLFRAS
ncbi:Reverse transcriptase domain-containing protein [Thalictrum thalictroides]|uniref:Reverse transcriptase domain-containing protein n=1 Tax=Thalictrum thalictroides TaxID=46969 RepID=A0A7J6X772_THATH|nr:Reverse transcriptase domain-containing protein [Thalictrum thalictroides]